MRSGETPITRIGCWSAPQDRCGTRIRVGATVIDHADGAVGIVRSVGTKAWIEVAGARRGAEFHNVEVRPSVRLPGKPVAIARARAT